MLLALKPMTPIRFEIRIEQLKDIFDEWSRERPDGSEISRAAILRRSPDSFLHVYVYMHHDHVCTTCRSDL